MAGLKVILYLLAALTCFACTVLLVREYLRTRARLLLWSSLCFVCLTVNNALLVVDQVIYPDIDMRIVRLVASLSGMLFLLYGFWEAES